MNHPHEQLDAIRKLDRNARRLAVVSGFVYILMTLMVLATGKDIITGQPPAAE